MAEKLQDLLKQENTQPMRPVSAGPRICPNCGAPTLSEVCQYCGQYVGTVETQDLTAEYPVLQCRNASITFWNFLFPMIFFVMFGFFGFIFPLFFRGFGDDDGFVQLIGLPFAAISIAAGVIIAVHLVRYLSVQFLGTETTAVVYGYMDDTISYNGRPGQVVKLLLDTANGKRFIFYRTGKTEKPYVVNSVVRLKVWRNNFRIMPEVYE